jgi:uncharacterized protein YifE (UPF0438 family)
MTVQELQHCNPKRPVAVRASSLLARYGHWLEALANGVLIPNTPAQRRFVQVAQGRGRAASEFEIAWSSFAPLLRGGRLRCGGNRTTTRTWEAMDKKGSGISSESSIFGKLLNDLPPSKSRALRQ